MPICPWCEGRKITAYAAWAEEPAVVPLLASGIPLVGLLLDRPCKICQGTGSVSKQRHAQLTQAPARRTS